MEGNKNNKLIIICIMTVIVVALVVSSIVFVMSKNHQPSDKAKSASTEVQTNSNVVTNSNSQNSNVQTNDNSYISKEKAQEIALENAGVSVSNTKELKVNLDYENGKEIYEVDFKSGNMEYDYDIDPITGNIIKADKKIDD